MVTKMIPTCLCGCGAEVGKYSKRPKLSRFVKGHHFTLINRQRRKPGNRYNYLRINGKTIREHRKIIEDHLRACLLPWASIHHKNGNKKDNRLENLELMNKAKHVRLHRPRLGTGKYDLTQETVCACGCGQRRLLYAKGNACKGRERRFINGHNRRKVI